MADCPRCHHAISSSTVRCPQCGLELKAHGHPGITLYRAEGDTALCDRCVYDADDSCTFPQRPHAQTCTLFQDVAVVNAPTPADEVYRIPWWRKHRGWVALAVLLGISLIIALL